ncbi:MAG: serine hydrolase, partial [Glaciecola sp.]
ETVAPWTLNAASGAGAVVSTLDDMIKYTQHVMAEVKNDTALARTLFTPYTNMSACCEQALGWILLKDKKGKTYAWHNGMTGGFSAFMGFYLDGSRAIVMLNNQVSSFDNKAHALLANEIDLTQI